MTVEIAVSHVGICTSDLNRSIRFYTEALHFKFEYCVDVGQPFDVLTELAGIKCRAGFLRQDGLRIEIVGYDTPEVTGTAQRRPMNQLGMTHLSLVVDDIDKVATRIAAFGGQVHAETKVATPKGQLLFCTDPDGVRLELWQKAK